MGVTTESRTESTKEKRRSTAKKQIRGSSLLLAGRLLSVGVNFVSQVLIVRYLSTADYGAWAYALSVVAFFQGIATIGLDRAITRFVPIYHEKEEYSKMFGTIVLVFGSTLLTGVIIISSFYLFPEQILSIMTREAGPIALLFVMIFLIPVQAVDGLLIGLFASLASPRAIFFRKYVLGPGLKLAVVIMLLGLQTKVLFLAYGYLAASLLGVSIYSVLFLRLLQKQGLFRHWQWSRVDIPAKEIFSFTIPLMTSDVVNIVMSSFGVLLLGYFHNAEQVAYFQVVLPAARLNKIVMTSFALLYTPSAARLFAKDDYEGINELYWRTAVWLAVLSFPIFVMTFSMSEPLTVFLYGERYRQSGLILAMLALGYYFNAALGFNGLTLKVLGKLKYIVSVHVAAALFSIVINLILIPRYGALGAGIGTSVTMILHNIFKQAGLRFASGVRLFDWHYMSFYALIAGSGLGLFVLQRITGANFYVGIGAGAVVSLAILVLSKAKLNVAESFPELQRLPIIGKFLR